MPFIPSRRIKGPPTLQTLPRPSSKVRTTALSGTGPAPTSTRKYSSAPSVTYPLSARWRSFLPNDSGSRLWNTNTGMSPRGKGPPVTNGG